MPTTPTVRLEHGALRRGDERIPLLMGEMHYWRLAPEYWRRALESCRRLGLDMVATYVPWQDHELAPGRFDFTGASSPRRNLAACLDLVHELGFRCFIRPGPYIYSEWTNAGVPDRVALLPRISEAYRREAAVWMRAVTAFLRPYFATSTGRFASGGPIVLFQPDNEMDLFSHWFEAKLGLDGPAAPEETPGEAGRVFQEFLRSAYPDIAALNTAWETTYADFDHAQPAASPTDRSSPGALARARDSWRFQHWATAEALDWHARLYRDLGVDLPMLANYYPGGDVQNWRALSRTSVDMLGIDWYPRSEFTGPPPPPGAAGASGGGGIFGLPPAREHRVFLDSCRLQRAVSPVPFIAELECGVWHGYESYTGSFPPSHYRLLACSALLAGIKGWNWYMFVGRDNWCFSPVNERGDIRPDLGEEFVAIHRVWRELDPPTLDKLAPAAAFFDTEQIGTDDLLGSNPVLQALYDAGADHEILDIDTLRGTDQGGPRLLLYAAAEWLETRAQERLVSWMEAGGTLVVFRAWPRADSSYRPHNGLGIQLPDRVLSHLGKKLELRLGQGNWGGPPAAATAEGGVWVWDTLPPGAEPITATQVAGKQQAIENADVWMRGYIGKRWTVGYRQPRGRGSLVVIGMPVNPDLVRAILTAAGAGPPVRAELPGVQTALFRRESDLYLLAAHLGPATQTRIAIHGASGRLRLTDLFTGQDRTMDADNLVIYLGRASGGAWRIQPA